MEQIIPLFCIGSPVALGIFGRALNRVPIIRDQVGRTYNWTHKERNKILTDPKMSPEEKQRLYEGFETLAIAIRVIFGTPYYQNPNKQPRS